jgi:ATP-dependent Lon protease
VANLFGHMNGKQKGMVQIWDMVGFDEVADLEKMPKEVITTMKTFCESGTYQRGQEAASGDASMALFGNTNQPVEVMVQTGHLFAPMPDVIRDDMAFIDRLHFYLPGWEIPKMRNDLFTDHYGFVVDYLAEALRELRKHNFTEISDRHFSMGAHLNARDRKAVRKTVSGSGEDPLPARRDRRGGAPGDPRARRGGPPPREGAAQEDGLLRVLPHVVQLHSDRRPARRSSSACPSRAGATSSPSEPLPPGTVYTATVDAHGTVGLFRVEVTNSSGTAKLKAAGGVSGATKESVGRAHAYLNANKNALGLAREFDTTDLHVEVIDLLNNKVEAEIGIAFLVAAMSSLRRAPVAPGLLVLGDLSIQGNIKALRSLTEPLQVAMDNGAKRALIPIENKRNFLDVSADIMEHVDPVFYGDPKTAALKALGVA